MINIPVEVIRLEAARRLHFEHGLAFADIDRLKFLGILRVNNQSGLLWDNFQRFVPYVSYEIQPLTILFSY